MDMPVIHLIGRSFLQLKTEVKGSGSGTGFLPGVPLFVFFQSLIGFLGAVTVGMKTAVEEGAGKKLIKFG